MPALWGPRWNPPWLSWAPERLSLLAGHHTQATSARGSPQVANRPISGLASEQIAIGGWVPADRLVFARYVVQHPLYEGVSVIGTRDDVVHFPPGFVLAFSLSLAYRAVKVLIHIPLNLVRLLIREEVR